jgi:hypothetical protein
VTTAAQIALMPDWPARMGEDLAARYLGVSLTAFRERVMSGVYPQPVREGKRRLWARRQLDRYVDAQFGLPHHNGPEDGSWDNLR